MKSFLFFLISILIGTISVWGYTQYSQKDTFPTPILQKTRPTKTVNYSIKDPPKNALIGTITTLEGDAQWESRTATEPAELKQNHRIVQGEKIVTYKDGGSSILFGQDTTISIKQNSTVSFVQTLPQSIVVAQEKGTVTYSQELDTTPVSVRVRNLLIRLQKGSMSISLKDEDPIILVQIRKGIATAAYNDDSFNSQVIAIEKGETFVYDSDARDGAIE